MDIDRLVTMANEIAAFFHGTGETEEAAQHVATHLRRYWDPRMRKQLVDYSRSGGAGLEAPVRAALELLAQSTPAS